MKGLLGIILALLVEMEIKVKNTITRIMKAKCDKLKEIFYRCGILRGSGIIDDHTHPRGIPRVLVGVGLRPFESPA